MNKPLTLEELKNFIGKDIWLIINRSFGGRVKLVRITEDKIWTADTSGAESYLDISDLNKIAEIYAEKPSCYNEINKDSIG